MMFLFVFLLIINVNAININKDKIEVTLKSCVDGDTAKFIYQNETIKVRFLAIDTPELKHEDREEEKYAREAKEFACNKLKDANEIYLEFDPNSDKQDKYDRYLAWVFVDDNLLQKDIIIKGYAKVAYLYGDYKYTDILKKEQRRAQKNKLGIWHDYEYINYNYIILFFILGLVILTIILLLFNRK